MSGPEPEFTFERKACFCISDPAFSYDTRLLACTGDSEPLAFHPIAQIVALQFHKPQYAILYHISLLHHLTRPFACKLCDHYHVLVESFGKVEEQRTV